MSHQYARFLVPVVALLTLLVPLVPAAPAAPDCGASGCETLALFFHVGGSMDESAGERPTWDPTTYYYTADGVQTVYGTDVADAMTLPAGGALRLVLFRDPAQENDYTTAVELVVRDGGEPTVAFADSVTAHAAPPERELRPLAGQEDPRPALGDAYPAEVQPDFEGAIGPYSTACALTGPVGRGDLGSPDVCYKVPSLLRLASRVTPREWQNANAEVSEQLEPSEPAALVAGWQDITFALPSDVVVPAGARLEIRITTTYEGSPVEHLPQQLQDRFKFDALARPEIINRHDTAEHPSRLELTVLSG